MRDWMKKIGKTEETDNTTEKVVEEVKKVDSNLIESLIPFRKKNKFYISKVVFNPDDFETYEMHEEKVAATFLNDQNVSLKTFFSRYQKAKSKK